jgi:DNA-binding transcriptional MerR regulator
MHRSTDNQTATMAGQYDEAFESRYFPIIPLPRRLPAKPLAIADMANFFGVTHRTLHFYEEKKLLCPSRNGAMRVYPPHEVKAMALINLCRETGMPIVQIQELLVVLNQAESQHECDRIFREALADRRKELLADESLLRRQMQQISEILDHAVTDDDGNDNRQAKIPFLTQMEHDCLALMAEGYTPVRIAAALKHDLEAVMTTEASIIRKFGSSNRFQAVAKAVLLGLVGTD